ncbi:FtsW/RodA/SpoVE family cell cycle protein [Shuttleworthella satelles]|uniref:Probable peptidoglycan glycosyltransferase FtsW n=1 Tax=Shuttleworthella satelles DSM 14600 TaxID=626523 RepID=C4GAA8_9FIRM|nr:putative peptidoglycan glycosyltransferase FtsW [Shuttleworthia satelles]EEP28641.1 putative cell division protein FtsW [Shuttleworthia satelles DSM 14600]
MSTRTAERKRSRFFRKQDKIISRELSKRRASSYVDYTLVLLLILLMGFGFLMLYSTSSYSSYMTYGHSFHYLIRQGSFAILGLAAMLALARMDYRKLCGLRWPIYILAWGGTLLLLVFGRSANGSTRWLRLGPVSVQPSEIAKTAVIILTAGLISLHPRLVNQWKGLVLFSLAQLALAAPILKENMSTSIIVVGIVFFMLLIASRERRAFFYAGLIGLGLGTAGVVFGGAYRLARIRVWLHPELDASDKGYQTMQALYAIGSGGLFGKGLGESMQKQFIPEAQNDMIFSVITEELGIFGAVILIILYLVLIWRLTMIAMYCKDLFGSFLVIGIAVHMGLQVLMNIAVVTNSMPNTGVTLPFVSYGGSALLMTMIEMGIALSVSKNTGPGLDQV